MVGPGMAWDLLFSTPKGAQFSKLSVFVFIVPSSAIPISSNRIVNRGIKKPIGRLHPNHGANLLARDAGTGESYVEASSDREQNLGDELVFRCDTRIVDIVLDVEAVTDGELELLRQLCHAAAGLWQVGVRAGEHEFAIFAAGKYLVLQAHGQA